MSEETSSSSPPSEHGDAETLETPSGKGKGKKDLWMKIVAVLIVVMLVGVAAWYLTKGGGGPRVIDPALAATIAPANPTVDAGGSVDLTCTPTVDTRSTVGWTNVSVRWAVVPSTLGGFDLLAQRSVAFAAGPAGGSGTLWCNVTYTFDEEPDTDGTQTAKRFKNASTSVTITPPFLQTVEVSPSSWTQAPGSGYNYEATALTSVGGDITADTNFTWTISGAASAGCYLNSSYGWIVNFTAGSTEGNVTLSVVGLCLSVSVEGNASIEINSSVSPRTVDYVWYDMFNVPFDQWRYRRSAVYGDEVPFTNSYPYIFTWKGQPPGNWYKYSNLRLNITARNMSEINMLQRPEFLPLFGTARGGTAIIDWNIGYLNQRDYANYPAAVQAADDGWLSVIKGNITLDEQAAKSVLGLSTHDDWLNFTTTWWPDNGVSIATRWSNWFDSEAGIRNAVSNPHGLDIYCAYGGGLGPLNWDLTATKVGDKVILHSDYVSWGGEILLTRWMHDTFMPTEWYFEGGDFHMTIGPQMADLDMDSAISYGMYAYEETLNAGEPCWVWESIVQDYIYVLGHKSDYRRYMNFDYLNTAPGSYWYNQNMTYDYAPRGWNLTDGETLEFIWPSGNQTFLRHGGAYVTINDTAEMSMEFGEPMASDNPELAPGFVVVDNDNNFMKYYGPIDMWNWSYNIGLPGYRAPHDWLNSEWNRMHVLPYGAPYLEWKMLTTSPEVIDHFTVSGAKNPVNATESTGVTVTAYNNHGTVMTTYTGTVNFTSSDLAASKPGDYSFVAGDNGVHTFSGITFATVGTQNITVHDVATPTAKGSQEGIVVQSAPAAASIVVSGVQSNRVVETPLSVTVTVLDQRGYTFKDYLGTVNFTSNMSYSDVTLPADYTFVPADQGVYTFTDMVVFHTEGWYTITCTDTVDAAVTGSQTGILALLTPPHLDHLVITGPATAFLGAAFDVTVTAYDQNNNVFDAYDGLVSFSTNASAGTYTLPADYLFVPATDSGAHVFAGGVVFNQLGVYSVIVSDIANGTSASLDDISVIARSMEIKYTMYDIMMQPWGEWYNWRYPIYTQDIVLNTNPGESTMVYNPDKTGMQGIIYAPYRWNVTASNMTTLDVGAPMIMPANGTPDVPGAEASVNIYMEYLDNANWLNYWWGTWHSDPTWTGNATMNKQKLDGYYLGVVYKVVMNREAAEEWMGMPQASDVATWWAANGATYKTDWQNWILWQGNSVYDIFCGYEFKYANMELYMSCSELPTGEVQLNIGHVNWGFEVLITRWMRAADICHHETYMENLTLNAHYNSLWGDVTYDGVCQYSLRAVQANKSTGDGGAWQWEPAKIDYIASISGHISDFDTWALLTYKSHAAMDPLLGSQVAYDATPQSFNLTDYMTFEVKLRDGTNVLGYKGIKGDIWYDPGLGMDITCIINAAPLPFGYGDKSNYTAAETHGWMSLGYYESNGVDFGSMYDNTTKILTIHGPYNFENYGRGIGIARYHGAPLLEFNVTPIVAKATSVPTEMPVTNVPAPVSAEPVAASGTLLSMAAVTMLMLLVVMTLGVSVRREENS